MNNLQLKLIAKDKHNKRRTPSEVLSITRDGWVITKDGTYGDLGVDCEVALEIPVTIKQFRKEHGLSQQELGWMFGKSRQTIITYEQENHDITLREYLIMTKLKTNQEIYREIYRDIKQP